MLPLDSPFSHWRITADKPEKQATRALGHFCGV
jgi:hypothetical protein